MKHLHADWVTRKIKFQLDQDFKIHYGTGGWVADMSVIFFLNLQLW